MWGIDDWRIQWKNPPGYANGNDNYRSFGPRHPSTNLVARVCPPSYAKPYPKLVRFLSYLYKQGIHNSDVFVNRASVHKTTQGFRDIQIVGRWQSPHAAKYFTNRGVFCHVTILHFPVRDLFFHDEIWFSDGCHI